MLLGELDGAADERDDGDDDARRGDEARCTTCSISPVKLSSSLPAGTPSTTELKSIPSPIGAAAASLVLTGMPDDMALATLDAAIVAAELAARVPLAPTPDDAAVEEVDRTVIRGVEVTPALSLPRRRLGIDRAGCGRAPGIVVLCVPILGVVLSLDKEPAVPGLRAAFPEEVAVVDVFIDVRVEEES